MTRASDIMSDLGEAIAQGIIALAVTCFVVGGLVGAFLFWFIPFLARHLHWA